MAMRNQGGVLELLELKRYTNSTSSPALSNPDYNAVLGAADRVIVHAFITDNTGTDPTLSVIAEDSSDGENWAEVALDPTISNIAASPPGEVVRGAVDFPHGRYLRFSASVGGTGNPSVTFALRASLKNA